MELMTHSDISDKELVNTYGGVAYDHESMPRVVAVHSWTVELQNSYTSYRQGQVPHLPSHELFPPNSCYSMKIDVRSSPQDKDFVSKRICTVSRDNLDSHYKNKFSLSDTPSFAVEKLSRKEERQINNRRTGTGTVGILRTLWQESGKDPFAKYCHSDHKSLWGKDHVFMSQKGNLLLTENTNTKDMPVTNVLPLDGKLISPCCLNSIDKYPLKANKTGTRNLESHDWSRVGVLAAENSEQLHVNSSRKRLKLNRTSSLSYSRHISEGEAFGKDCLQGQTTEISVPQNKPKLTSPLCNSTEQTQISQMPVSNSRKRPRKSIPRKIDMRLEWQRACSSSDGEGTSKVSESPNQGVSGSPLHEGSSSESDKESSGVTKVLFKRTAGVWSVSPVHTSSDSEENKALEDSPSWKKESTKSQLPYGTPRSGNKPATNICVFTDRPIASLVPYNPLKNDNVEPIYSSALDREARIKELLSKQEKLLAKVRQRKSDEE